MKTTLYLLVALLAISMASQASTITFTLNPASQSGAPGTTLIFSGSFTNTTPDPVFLNSLQFSSIFSTDSTPFLVNSPNCAADPAGSCLDGFGGSGSIDLFMLTIPIPFTQGPGIYQETVTLLGGADVNAQINLGSAIYTVDVGGAVPEPSSVGLALFGCAALVALGRRRSRAA
jgi:hypothetical protein